MKLKNLLRGRCFIALLTTVTMILSGCGSDSSSSSSTLSGTAATGAAMVGHIEITDANGNSLTNVTINSDGSYSANVTNMTSPFLVVAIPDDTNLPMQYSYAASLNVTVNVSPLTTLALFLANNQQDLAALSSNWNSSTVDATALSNAQAKINANFSPQLQAQGLDATTYDFFSGNFAADGTGFDAMLDGLTIDIDMTGGTFTIQAGGTPFTFNTSIDISNININIGGGNGGGNGGTLPDGVASKLVTMEYGSAAAGSPYNNGDQILFTFSSSGTLMLTEQYTVVADSFTVDSYGQYIWTDSTGIQYVLSLLNGEIHEVNVMDANDNLLGQFTPVSYGVPTPSGGDWTLTLSGSYSQTINSQNITVNIPTMTLDGPFALPDSSAVENYTKTYYGATGTVTVTVMIDVPDEKKFSVQFTGTVGVNDTASYIMTYDYNKVQ